MAERFGKRHTEVLRAIKKLLADSPDEEFSRRNFASAKYLDAQEKPRLKYRITHNGFAILAMGFSGKKALVWKMAFLEAFRAMEAELRAALERESAALYTLRPHWRQIAEGTAAGLDRAAICQITGHRSPNTITANRRRMRAAGLLN